MPRIKHKFTREWKLRAAAVFRGLLARTELHKTENKTHTQFAIELESMPIGVWRLAFGAFQRPITRTRTHTREANEYTGCTRSTRLLKLPFFHNKNKFMKKVREITEVRETSWAICQRYSQAVGGMTPQC